MAGGWRRWAMAIFPFAHRPTTDGDDRRGRPLMAKFATDSRDRPGRCVLLARPIGSTDRGDLGDRFTRPTGATWAVDATDGHRRPQSAFLRGSGGFFRRPISRRPGRPLVAMWGFVRLRDRPTGATDATDRRGRRMGAGWRGHFPRSWRTAYADGRWEAGGSWGCRKNARAQTNNGSPRHRASQGRDAGRERLLAMTAASRDKKCQSGA